MTTLLAAHPLVHINASLNALAIVLLLLGRFFIKRGQLETHRRAMLAAFAVSILFLVCYLWYHAQVGSVKFTYPGAVRYVYLVVLASHVLLAATVPFLAVWQIYLGYRATSCCRRRPNSVESAASAEVYRQKHVWLAKWVFPIWLYVSVTGVVVYIMLYHLWPPTGL